MIPAATSQLLRGTCRQTRFFNRSLHLDKIRVRLKDRIGVDGKLLKTDRSFADELGNGLIPRSSPVSESELDRIANILAASSRTTVLTGAGVSTASGIPDYRGPGGAYTRDGYKPMSHQTFMGTEAARSRYWARNFAGWEQFKGMLPNASHISIAELQKRHWVDFIITQNVDRLHHKAGSSHIIELHGTTHHVVCVDCGDLTEREDFQTVLAELNPAAPQTLEMESSRRTTPEEPTEAASVRPDGDVELRGREKGFRVPACMHCEGILKPHVVFFGDSVPRSRADMAFEICAESEVLLVIGSSVAVYSAYRLVKAARDNAAQNLVLTDPLSSAMVTPKVECVTEEVLTRLAAHPLLAHPRSLQIDTYSSPEQDANAQIL